MPLEYEVRRCTRRCAVTGKPFAPGEAYYSVLVEQGSELQRIDLAPESWQGPPEEAIGWWRAQLPDQSGKRRLAPNEVLLSLLEKWADDPQQASMRYVLALLLIRRKVLRIEQPSFAQGINGVQGMNEQPVAAKQALRLYCPHNDATYEVPSAVPNSEEATRIDAQLLELLHADAA